VNKGDQLVVDRDRITNGSTENARDHATKRVH
jgi:hypothetical protein